MLFTKCGLLLNHLSVQFASSNNEEKMMKKMPVLFVGHGSPMNVLEKENPFNQNFSLITQNFAKPKAILMISAHWYSSRLQVTSGEHPEMIYDFYGFPEELSQVQYPAPGSPELAEQVRSLLQPENVELNPTRGFDHGAWAVLKFLYPNADIPVVQLSLNRLQQAQWHFNLAKKLAALREQGVLIIGSGNIVHNLRAISWEHINQIGAGYDWAYAFRDHINHAMMTKNDDDLVHYEQFGEGAVLSVPTPDHYLPLLYVMALRAPEEKVAFFNDNLIAGSLSMTSVLVG
ncbi:aromatic ring-opening dioxygenase, catalytic subunit LigB [Aggregatibacter sp. oral taxon 458 str. W10330]|nr:aromatic ring-opening dioxygenase, catalytic subunit LigB [Aggregatibacter sp. oral taxon 458 str. W10330]